MLVNAATERHGPAASPPYVNLTHAVPEQFSLSSLPASPARTPRLNTPVESSDDVDGYFHSTRIFSSAAVVPAYHDFHGPIMRRQQPPPRRRGSSSSSSSISLSSPVASFSLPATLWFSSSSSPFHPHPFHTPTPIVPPDSVHTAVLERYLPPSCVDEHRDFFSADRPSHLVDRLSELSLDGGSLVLVYPTQRGAISFQEQYLASVLDPLIRQLVVVNGMSAELGRILGSYSLASRMDSFEGLKDRLRHLCEALSSDNTTTTTNNGSSSNAGPRNSRFTLVSAAVGHVSLDKAMWSGWYIGQERKRFKDVLHLYPSDSNCSLAGGVHRMFGAPHGMNSTVLLTDILEGLRKRQYDGRSQGPIELGIFVIRRNWTGPVES